MINWTFLVMQACIAMLIGLAFVAIMVMVRKLLDARRKIKLDRRVDAYLPKIKAMNAETIERKRQLVSQLKLCAPAIKINGKREAAYWNSVLNALAECKPMEEEKLIGIAVLFASLEQDFGREVTPDHLMKEAALIDKAERCWRKLLDLIGDPKKLLAAKPQA